MRPLACLTGSKFFADDSVVAVRPPADSRSFRSAAGDLDEALRHHPSVWRRADGTRARGNDLARYLDDSLAAIGMYRGGDGGDVGDGVGVRRPKIIRRQVGDQLRRSHVRILLCLRRKRSDVCLRQHPPHGSTCDQLLSCCPHHHLARCQQRAAPGIHYLDCCQSGATIS